MERKIIRECKVQCFLWQTNNVKFFLLLTRYLRLVSYLNFKQHILKFKSDVVIILSTNCYY